MIRTMMGDVAVVHDATIRRRMTVNGEGHPLNKGGVPEVEVVEDLLMITVLEEGAMTMMGETSPLIDHRSHIEVIRCPLQDEPGYAHLEYRQWWSTTATRCTCV